MLLKLIVAVLIAVIVAGVLDYLGVLTNGLNALIGILCGLLYFFGTSRGTTNNVL